MNAEGMRTLAIRLGSLVFHAMCLFAYSLCAAFLAFGGFALGLFVVTGGEDPPYELGGLFFLGGAMLVDGILATAVALVFLKGRALLKALATSRQPVFPAPDPGLGLPQFPGRFGLGYRVALVLIVATGLAIYVLYPFAQGYTVAMEAHRVLGVGAYLLLPIFLYLASRQTNRRAYSLLIATYPLFCIASVLTSNALLVVFLVNVVFLPLFFLTLSLDAKRPEEKLAVATWCAFVCLLSLTISTGQFSVMDPNRLRFSFTYREYHAFFVFWLILFNAWLVWLRVKRKRLTPESLRGLTWALAISCALSLPVRAVVNAPRHYLIQRDLDERTFATKALATANHAPFRTIPAGLLQRGAECSSCHPLANRQWIHSTHAFAASNASFQKVLRSMAAQHGYEYIRLCATCHDPGVALSADPSLLVNDAYLKTSDGVGCRACHYMSSGDEKNGLYSITIPRSDWLYTTGPSRERYIKNSVLEHIEGVSRPFLKSGAACYPCHSLESQRNGKTLHPVDNVSSFLRSSYFPTVKCHQCHMPRTAKDDHSYSWQDHAFLGVNESLDIAQPTQDATVRTGIRALTERTRDWLAGTLPRVDAFEVAMDETVKSYRVFNYISTIQKLIVVEKVLSAPSPFAMALQRARFREGPPRTVDIDVTVMNDTIGHDFPSSLFANIEDVSVRLVVTDARGQIVYSPALAPEASRRLGRVEVDAAGAPILPEDSPRYATIVNHVVLEPQVKHLFQFAVPLPEGVSYPMRGRVEVVYKRYNDHHVQWFSAGKTSHVDEKILGSAQFDLRPH